MTFFNRAAEHPVRHANLWQSREPTKGRPMETLLLLLSYLYLNVHIRGYFIWLVNSKYFEISNY
jgi:hypothetical protein